MVPCPRCKQSLHLQPATHPSRLACPAVWPSAASVAAAAAGPGAAASGSTECFHRAFPAAAADFHHAAVPAGVPSAALQSDGDPFPDAAAAVGGQSAAVVPAADLVAAAADAAP